MTNRQRYFPDVDMPTPVNYKALKDMTPEQMENFALAASYPLANISYYEAALVPALINAISYPNGPTQYALATETQWEYAARAGATEWKRTSAQLNGMEWHFGNSKGVVQPAGKKIGYGWGIFDMLGNVKEWVQADSTTYSLKNLNNNYRQGEWTSGWPANLEIEVKRGGETIVTYLPNDFDPPVFSSPVRGGSVMSGNVNQAAQTNSAMSETARNNILRPSLRAIFAAEIYLTDLGTRLVVNGAL